MVFKKPKPSCDRMAVKCIENGRCELAHGQLCLYAEEERQKLHAKYMNSKKSKK